jgi:hypothetical protein
MSHQRRSPFGLRLTKSQPQLSLAQVCRSVRSSEASKCAASMITGQTSCPRSSASRANLQRNRRPTGTRCAAVDVRANARLNWAISRSGNERCVATRVNMWCNNSLAARASRSADSAAPGCDSAWARSARVLARQQPRANGPHDEIVKCREPFVAHPVRSPCHGVSEVEACRAPDPLKGSCDGFDRARP